MIALVAIILFFSSVWRSSSLSVEISRQRLRISSWAFAVNLFDQSLRSLAHARSPSFFFFSIINKCLELFLPKTRLSCSRQAMRRFPALKALLIYSIKWKKQTERSWLMGIIEDPTKITCSRTSGSDRCSCFFCRYSTNSIPCWLSVSTESHKFTIYVGESS